MADTAAETTQVRRSRRKRGPYAKTAATREKILAAAADVAVAEGLHKVSLSEVARRAHVAIGNVSYHFGSREELLQALMRSVADELALQVVQSSPAGGDYFERAEAGLRAYLAFLHRNPAYVRLGEEVRHHRPEIHRRFLDAWLEGHRAGLRQGIAEGTLRPMGAAELAVAGYLLVGMAASIGPMVEAICSRAYPGDDAVVATFMHLLRGGLERPVQD